MQEVKSKLNPSPPNVKHEDKKNKNCPGFESQDTLYLAKFDRTRQTPDT